jgi:hypothetical protein
MSNTNTGGAAFPYEYFDEQLRQKQVMTGVTLRDYFAAKALPISYKYWMNDYYHPDASDAEIRAEEERTDFTPDMQMLIAETAYEMANAMLKARES